MKLILTKSKFKNSIILYLFFTFYFVVGLLTYQDYGISIEEHTQRLSGLYWLNYVVNFFKIDSFTEVAREYFQQAYDPSLPDPKIHSTYGPIFDLPTAFLDILFNIKKTNLYFQYRHLLVFIIFFSSSIVFYKILKERFSKFFVSFFGVLIYIFTPRIYGDSFHNNKDIIFLSLVVFTIFFAFRFFDKKGIKNIVLFAFFAALATSTRIMGLFLPVSFLIFLLLDFQKKEKKSFFINIIIMTLLYFIFLFIHWPYLWEEPINSFINFVIKSKDTIFTLFFLFNGKYYLTTSLPDSYIFIWMGISTPILNIILFLFGFIFTIKRFFLRLISVKEISHYKDFWRGKCEKKDLYILFNLISIIALLVSINVSLVGGWRHLYFLNIFIVYLATFSIYLITLKFKKSLNNINLLLFIFFIPNIYKIIIFHPYQSLYFNEVLSDKRKNSFQVDRECLTQFESINKIISLEKNLRVINVANASDIPYYRVKDMLSDSDKKKVIFVGNDFYKADYIYNNFSYKVDPKYEKKYRIPNNFKKIYKLEIEGVIFYEIYKKII